MSKDGQGDFVRAETAKERRRRELREEKATAIVTRRAQMFDRALFGEKLGPHPGRVEVRIEARMYDAIERRYVRVPGFVIELGVETVKALMEARDVMEEGLKQWLTGGR